jgi:hypothetical protein
MHGSDWVTGRTVFGVALGTFVLIALMSLSPSPAAAEGVPIPPFEDETWRIDINHSDEYWLNVRYMVFRPGWNYNDQGFSGADVTGHSGCGDESLPMLLNTAYAAEGDHEIIIYYGGLCTHDGDDDEETKYDRYPNGTQIFVNGALEHFLPGEVTPIETIPVSGTVVVTGNAPPPVSLGAITVSGATQQTAVPETTATSSTTAEEDDKTAAVLGGEESDEATAEADGESELGTAYPFLVLVIALTLGGLTAALLIGYLLRRRMGWARRDALHDTAHAEGLEYWPSDPTTLADDALNFVKAIAPPVAEAAELSPVPATPSPSDPPVAAEAQPVAEQHLTEAFLDMASGTIGELAPTSPPQGKLNGGRTWVWVSHPLEVDYYDGGPYSSELVENKLQPGRWYQASPRTSNNSCTVWTEDGEHLLGDKVHDVRPAPDQNLPPNTRP